MANLPAQPTLADLRREIDRIDAAMHDLLMERGEIIDTLIRIKNTQDSGSAFRPGREASMMRNFAERHRGNLPFDTVESIWRVIISTFTYVQAPYTVHADVSGGDAPMRDTARFHFGFTVPYMPHDSAASVIDAVARSAGDLGVFRAEPGRSAGAWWTALTGAGRPKIIARLPFVERPGHPAGTPVYVISKPIADAAVRDNVLYALGVERWRDGLQAALAKVGATVEHSAGEETGLNLLVAAPGAVSLDDLYGVMAGLGVGVFDIEEIGSHAARFRLDSAKPRNP
ncbi:chorismate mutase [Alsobacter sp. SYSU M60028]|uniref:chorismate mutase n=1 Tax=Alsobacter ponti TaxID=2962936 RepID=A0ABT1LB31_9HYPH|nr:chorismate mutase [Alsobacter ponti]MCP8938701.1 chorismate mutase [Alsobacter ponti]